MRGDDRVKQSSDPGGVVSERELEASSLWEWSITIKFRNKTKIFKTKTFIGNYLEKIY